MLHKPKPGNQPADKPPDFPSRSAVVLIPQIYTATRNGARTCLAADSVARSVARGGDEGRLE